MKNIKILTLKSSLFKAALALDIMNFLLCSLIKCKRMRTSRLVLRYEEKVMKKRQYVNTAVKRFVIASIQADEAAAREYLLSLANTAD